LGLKRKVADLSHHNGRPDFEKVKKEVDAVILSVGYGSDFTSQDDREYQRSVSECERLGIPYGIYLFGYAENMAMVNSEIAHVKRQIKGRKPRYPVYYDIEIPQLASFSNQAYTQWQNDIKNAGHKSGLYTYNSMFKQYGMNNIKCDNLWIASYGNNDAIAEAWEKPNIGTDYNAWQYTSTARIDGINGNVDISEFYTDFQDVVEVERTVRFVGSAVYRLYNKVTGEHFFTEGYNEAQTLVDAYGYVTEGIGWKVPKYGKPVHRLYNPITKVHHYTISDHEKDVLTKERGWIYEGVAWHSETDPKKQVPVFRLAFGGKHHYTTGVREKEGLVRSGWAYEGVAFYGTK
jgi:GH25 family lysozyme M1 (1,4-beta-N-acetylmuramidase)